MKMRNLCFPMTEGKKNNKIFFLIFREEKFFFTHIKNHLDLLFAREKKTSQLVRHIDFFLLLYMPLISIISNLMLFTLTA